MLPSLHYVDLAVPPTITPATCRRQLKTAATMATLARGGQHGVCLRRRAGDALGGVLLLSTDCCCLRYPDAYDTESRCVRSWCYINERANSSAAASSRSYNERDAETAWRPSSACGQTIYWPGARPADREYPGTNNRNVEDMPRVAALS